MPITGESSKKKRANRTSEARLDISSRSVWVTDQKKYLDIRVFNPLAGQYGNSNILKSYGINEQEKKKSYNERKQNVHGKRM